MSLDQFVQLIQNSGPLGLAVGAIVLVAVYALTASKVVVTTEQKQAANVVLSLLLAGISLYGENSEAALAAVIASVASSLVHLGLKWLLRSSLKPVE